MAEKRVLEIESDVRSASRQSLVATVRIPRGRAIGYLGIRERTAGK